MRLVVDASVAVQVAERRGGLRRGASIWWPAAMIWHAPRLMASEIANALWRKSRLGEIERGRAGALMAAVSEMPVRWSADERRFAQTQCVSHLRWTGRCTTASTWRSRIVSVRES